MKDTFLIKIVKNKNVFLTAFILIIFAYFICSHCAAPSNDEIDPKRYLSNYIVSRIQIEEVKFFIDDRAMHGPKYFYFKSNADDMDKLMILLKLRRQVNFPATLSESLEYVKEKVDWQFDWSHYDVYAIYYCPKTGAEWGFDVFIINREKSEFIYITNGYRYNSSNSVENLDVCR